MLDIKLIRENPQKVKDAMKTRNKDMDAVVDEILEIDKKARELTQKADALKAEQNAASKKIPQIKKEGGDISEIMARMNAIKEEVKVLDAEKAELAAKQKTMMYEFPNVPSDSTPIGKDDSENVEVQEYGEHVVPDFEIPYHTEIMEKFNGIDLDSARRVAGNGFYYLMGDIARLHSAVISYARDFMIDRGFTYCVPPYMIRATL